VPAAPPIKYFFRLPIPNPIPNPITDPNPNPNPKISNKTKRHRNEIEHTVISKSRFPREGGEFIKKPITGMGKETHMDIPVF